MAASLKSAALEIIFFSIYLTPINIEYSSLACVRLAFVSVVSIRLARERLAFVRLASERSANERSGRRKF